jgi:hypothetical protein
MYDFQDSYTRGTDMALLAEGGLDASEISSFEALSGRKTHYEYVDACVARFLNVEAVVTSFRRGRFLQLNRVAKTL